MADENDVPPRWGRTEWGAEIEEGNPPGTLLATLTVKDPDTHNRLAYRVSYRQAYCLSFLQAHHVCYRQAYKISYMQAYRVSYRQAYGLRYLQAC